MPCRLRAGETVWRGLAQDGLAVGRPSLGERESVYRPVPGAAPSEQRRDMNHSSLSTSRVPGTALATPPSSSHWTLSLSPARGQDHVLATPKVPGSGPGLGVSRGQDPGMVTRGSVRGNCHEEAPEGPV